MPTLKSPRREAFALAIAAGQTLGNAYKAAGFTSDRRNASKLRKEPEIDKRIKEILRRRSALTEKAMAREIGKAALDKAYVIDRLQIVVERSLQERAVVGPDGKETGEYTFNAAGANKALELLGRELGMFINRSETGKPGEFASLTDEQLRQQIREQLAARGMSKDEIDRFMARRRRQLRADEDEQVAIEGGLPGPEMDETGPAPSETVN